MLADLFRIRGVPTHIRSDNGPEFIAQAIRRHGQQAGVETLYVEPGSPWENGYAESFHSRLRDELMNVEEFTNLAEARWFARRRLHEYNHQRPHSSLGYQTPAEFAAGCALLRSGYALTPAAQPNPMKPYRYPTHTLITPGTKNGGIPDVSSLAESVWGHEVRRGQTAQGTRGGEQAAEKAAGRSGARQGDPQGGAPGKLLSPARR